MDKKPFVAVDIIIEYPEEDSIILIKRKNPPYGWAIPGGFVEYGESAEETAIREAKEETNLEIELLCQFHSYSESWRDPRGHTISIVFIAKGRGEAIAMDDAKEIGIFKENDLPSEIAFDHERILGHYFKMKRFLKSVFLSFSELNKIFYE
ncbi:MAG: NUDIX domain-containing protein [Candidatus Aminicenantia bacterium]